MRRSTIKVLAGITQRDFFGIYDITSKDIAGAFASKTKLPSEKFEEKYEPLVKSRVRLVNEEKDKNVVFGRVRLDSDNLAKKHGQFEDNKTEKLYDTIEMKQMFVPETDVCGAAGNHAETNSIPEEPHIDLGVQHVPEVAQYNLPYKISEVQPIKGISEILQIFTRLDDGTKIATEYKNKPPLTFFFEEPFQATTSQDLNESSHPRAMWPEPSIKAEQREEEKEEEATIRRPQQDLDVRAGPQGARAPVHELDRMSEAFRERQDEMFVNDVKFDRSLDRKFDVSESEQPMKALDYLKKVRTKEIEPTAKGLKHRLQTTNRIDPLKPQITLDSQGFRNYTHQVPDWDAIRHVDVVSYIRSSIIYHNYDILAVNKPYGIASHANAQGRDRFDMNTLMHEVAKSMKIDKVYLAHRLDKTTTGVLLFATSQERADNLNKLFKSDEIKKKYWCITKGVPDPPQGVVDIPIAEIEVTGKLRSCPAPAFIKDEKQLARRFREARRAITEYRVVQSKRHVALVELKPQSGVKHQLRCHMSFALNTPILGDHKYSHLTRIAPQKLPPSLLNAFHLRQAKVRTLPIHLHAKSVVVPSAKANGETLFITAPLPQHFIDNMKLLKLSSE